MPTVSYIHVILPLRLAWEPVYALPDDPARPSVGVGTRVEVDFAGKAYTGVVSVAPADAPPAGVPAERIKPAGRIAAELAPVSEEEIALWRQVADYYLCTVGEVYKAAYPAGKTGMEHDKALADRRRREREENLRAERDERRRAKAARLDARIAALDEKIRRARSEETKRRYTEAQEAARAERAALAAVPDKEAAAPESFPAQQPVIRLSTAQEKACAAIRGHFAAGRTAYLHGVTGSGKTEIYLKLAQDTLREGRNVLYLAPEIALSRQLEERIGALFPDTFCVAHSGESAARRRDAADVVRHRPYLVLGTRSAVFLPHRNLGLVIVDEEQDVSYKQDSPAPRYNGRETAIMLAKIHGAHVVLGSATPSMEALYNCQAGRFFPVPLKERYYAAADADVMLIDTAAERRKNGMAGSLSLKLVEQIRNCLDGGGQAILLRERRSYSPTLQCTACGEIVKCSRCNVPVSLHVRADGSQAMVCHYCGRTTPYTGHCPSCGGDLAPLGAGTQKIEEEVKALFPGRRIARLDSDAARSRSFEKDTLRRFSAGETDILIGTQILSKGFDFSGLRLVAVLQADSILGQQDFRADEKAMQLLEQFRGRCGRRAEKGLFIIQTARPDHPVYRAFVDSAAQEAQRERLLAERKAFGYPPYSREIVVICKDSVEDRAERMMRALAARLRDGADGLPRSAVVVGPYAPPVDKVSGAFLRHIRILLRKDRELAAGKEKVAEITAGFEKEWKYSGHIALDVDPV